MRGCKCSFLSATVFHTALFVGVGFLATHAFLQSR